MHLNKSTFLVFSYHWYNTSAHRRKWTISQPLSIWNRRFVSCATKARETPSREHPRYGVTSGLRSNRTTISDCRDGWVRYHSWLVSTKDEEIILSGGGPDDGAPQHMTSYQSEFGGICDGMAVIVMMAWSEKINNISVRFVWHRISSKRMQPETEEDRVRQHRRWLGLSEHIPWSKETLVRQHICVGTMGQRPRGPQRVSSDEIWATWRRGGPVDRPYPRGSKGNIRSKA
jgi:hypothetical protein